MESKTSDWIEWILIPVAVVLLAVLHRLDLLAIVVPISVVAAYALALKSQGQNSGRRKI